MTISRVWFTSKEYKKFSLIALHPANYGKVYDLYMDPERMAKLTPRLQEITRQLVRLCDYYLYEQPIEHFLFYQMRPPLNLFDPEIEKLWDGYVRRKKDDSFSELTFERYKWIVENTH